ncbi:VOC family protein [Fuscibacter oryzae]|uniref:VOC family protein n=1 Tax=Fuscibacter oryzae TaxID=2803939 RepID=A0A8J7SWY4_9RHOB|nr:VOC family protein [Fuscibacter oryzae]MBL4929409.1 VOC family protein [Fuscibacter oryzae]
MSIQGLDHIGFTVPDLETATAFLTALFGAEVVMETGPLDIDGGFMSRHLGVPPETRIRNARFLRLADGTVLEVFEYGGDPGRDDPPKRNSQPGGFHLAFRTQDAHAAAARLRAAGVDMLDGPTLIETGPLAGLTWIYFRAPWGQTFELVSSDRRLDYNPPD